MAEQKEIKCKHGRPACDGDYVLILDVNFIKRRGKTLIGKLYNGKIYTGVTMDTNRDKYIHKLQAEIVIPEYFIEDYIEKEIIKAIEKDILLHNPDYVVDPKYADRCFFCSGEDCYCCGYYHEVKKPITAADLFYDSL